ncbi:MAG: NBR1-Ig-like domain-containing protein [Phototrophicaceae bacterium]
MSLRNLLLTIGLILTLSACALGSSEPIATSTPTNTVEPTSTATVTPTLTLTSTPTLTPMATSTLRPTAIVPVPCTNDLTFIADMSIPDGSVVNVGSTITKVWRVRNDGTCAWNSNYTFRQIGGDALTANTITAPVVGSGQIVDMSVTVNVGTNIAAYDALERATFRMFNANGIAFGDSPYIEVAIRPETVTNCTNQVSIITAPSEIGYLRLGEVDTVSWTIQNTGTCTWTNYRLEKLGSDSPLIGNNLPLTLPTLSPNQTYTFSVNMTIAQDTNAVFGLFSISMQFVDNNNIGFGPTFIYQSEFDSVVGCTWDSDFVEDITIPDGTVVNVGQNFTKTWRLENSGTCAWENFLFIKIEDEDNAFEIIGAGTDQNFIVVPFVAPNEVLDLNVTLRLRDNVADGETVRATFQIQGVESTLFGTMPYVEVEANQ